MFPCTPASLIKNFPPLSDFRVSGKENISSLNICFFFHPDCFSLFLTRLFITLALVYPFSQLSTLAQSCVKTAGRWRKDGFRVGGCSLVKYGRSKIQETRDQNEHDGSILREKCVNPSLRFLLFSPQTLSQPSSPGRTTARAGRPSSPPWPVAWFLSRRCLWRRKAKRTRRTEDRRPPPPLLAPTLTCWRAAFWTLAPTAHRGSFSRIWTPPPPPKHRGAV